MRTIAFALLLVGCGHSQAPAPASAGSQAAAAPAASEPPAASPAVARSAPAATVVRENGFEYKVRADFFDGMRGDVAALDRSIKVCEDTLAAKPGHTEAMVWHGAGMVARSSLAFRAGDRARGVQLYQQGIAEMDRAVELDPQNIGVRIPRGAVVLGVVPFVPEPEKSKLLTRGTSDYELALAKQAPMFNQLTLHAREQLLYGLTDAFATLGDRAKAQSYYQRMTKDAAGSDLLPRAKARAAGEAGGPVACEACHAR